MSEIMRVNQPVSNSGYDNNTVRNNPIVSTDSQIQNIVDPSKVVRTDGKTEAEAEEKFAFSNESNYQGFVQALKETPQLAEIFSKIIMLDAQQMVTAGLSENFAQELSKFMDFLKMDAGQLLTFIKTQTGGAAQFNGAFFQSLKDILYSSNSVELRKEILSFIKHYSNMASGPHLLNNIVTEMDEVMARMFKADAKELKSLMDNLILPDKVDKSGNQFKQTGDIVRNNSAVFQQDIIPFLSKYVSRTRDMGVVREIMTLVTLNVARYIDGSSENVMQSFENLFKYRDFNLKLGELKNGNIEMILNRMLASQEEEGKTQWTDTFINIIDAGLKGEAGYENKAVFQNVMNAVLLNESVYMPLIHVFLPVELYGNMMLSEMWIDPDAEDNNSRGGRADKNIRMLIKFDIKDVGFFDLIIHYRDGRVDMMLAYPPKLAGAEKEIKRGLGQIVEQNGLSFHSFVVEQSRKPVSLMQVFPKIAEGRNSINVRI